MAMIRVLRLRNQSDNSNCLALQSRTIRRSKDTRSLRHTSRDYANGGVAKHQLPLQNRQKNKYLMKNRYIRNK